MVLTNFLIVNVVAVEDEVLKGKKYVRMLYPWGDFRFLIRFCTTLTFPTSLERK